MKGLIRPLVVAALDEYNYGSSTHNASEYPLRRWCELTLDQVFYPPEQKPIGLDGKIDYYVGPPLGVHISLYLFYVNVESSNFFFPFFIP